MPRRCPRKRCSLRVAAKALGLPEVEASLAGPTAIVVGGKNSAGVAKILKKVADESKALFILTHNYTGYPMVRQAREMIANGDLGAIRIGGLDVDLRITFSGGVVAREAGEPIAETITRADKAMYEAKAAGRDQSTIFNGSQSSLLAR